MSMELRELFADPSAEYRQAPFWFWNHALDTKTLSWQIEQMKEKGIGGFVMHARHGLLTPYLSDEWFECIRFCCAKAKELGMLAWAYDERDWPSGCCGGKVLEDRSNRMTFVRVETEEVIGPGTVFPGKDVVASFGGTKGERPLRLADEEITIPDGDVWELHKIIRFESPAMLWFDSYLDTLSRDACEAFVESTYDLHEQKLGNLKELGLAGFFTDEPALSTYPDDLRRIPWTDGLPRRFQEQKGYDVRDHLWDLFHEKEAGAQVRYDYWDIATGMFEDAFFKQIADWCLRRGLLLIGHPLGEEPLFFQFRCIGDIFRVLRHQHVPGMDHIAGTGIDRTSPNNLTPKLVQSVAALAGRERTMTETFGESGWGLTLREMKWMTDWQMVNGINYLIPHAFYYSIAGRRKKDSPPSEFYQTPHWPYYRAFADYTARVTAVLSSGVQVTQVAVLYPMSSVWADFIPGDNSAEVGAQMDRLLAGLCGALQELHYDFLIVDEQALVEAKAENGHVRIGNLTFEAIIVPPLTTLTDACAQALQSLAAECCTLSVGNDMVRCLGSTNDTPDAPKTLSLRGVQGMIHLDEATPATLGEALRGLTPDVQITDAPDVLHQHRHTENGEVFFFTNSSREGIDTTVSLATTGLAEVWDPETGKVQEACGQRIQSGRLELPLTLAPQGSRLIVVDTEREPREVPVKPFVPGRRMPLCQLWSFTPENGNLLLLQNWVMAADTRHKVTRLSYTTEFILNESIANMRLVLDGIPEHAAGLKPGARPLVAHETDAEIYLNGERLDEEMFWEFDLGFRVINIAQRLDAGTYRLELVVKNHGWFPQQGLQEYAWIAGDFSLDLSEGIPRLSAVRGIQCGPWEEQGFPYFSGTGDYFTDFDLSKDDECKRIFIDAGRVGDILEVEVNGQALPVRAWPPYRVEITDYTFAGTNLIMLKVSNTSRNFLEGPDPDRPSGLLDEVWLEIE